VILEDKCMKNELIDIKNINMPDWSQDQDDKDWFCFSANLQPGYHKVLIYDPKLERAFCKDFVV